MPTRAIGRPLRYGRFGDATSLLGLQAGLQPVTVSLNLYHVDAVCQAIDQRACQTFVAREDLRPLGKREVRKFRGHNTGIDKLGRQTKVTRPDPAGDPQSRFTVNRCDAVGYSVQPSR